MEGPIDKSDKLSYKEVGYRAIHSVVKLNQKQAELPQCREYKELRAEIQIRTIIENAWAEIEHHWNYKPDNKDDRLDEKLKRRLYGLMAILELVDREFDSIRESLQGIKPDLIIFETNRDLARSPELFGPICNLLSENGRYEDLVNLSKEAINYDETNVKAWINMVVGLLELHKDEKLLEVFDTLIKLDPNNIIYYSGKGFAYSELGKYDEALLWHDKALEIDPKNILALVERGIVLDEMGKRREAINYFDNAIELEPEYAHALISKGIALDHLEKYEEALELYDIVLEKKPEDTHALINKGLTLRNLKKIKDAIQIFDKALEFEPEDTYALINKGVALTDLEENEKAMQIFEEVLELEPRNIIALVNITKVLSDLGKCDEALKRIDKALEIEPDNVIVLFNKGSVLDKLGRSEEAKEIYDMAFVDIAEQFHKFYEERREIIEPELEAETIQGFMGILLAKSGEYMDAMKWVNSALKHSPKNMNALIGKSFLLEKLEKYQDALDILNSVLQNNPDDALVFFRIARIQSLIGNDKLALEYLTSAIMHDNKYKLNAKDDIAFERLKEQKEFKKLTS